MLLVCVQAMKKLFFIAYFFLSLEIYTFLQGEKKANHLRKLHK